MAEETEFVAEVNSSFEPLVIDRICAPVLRHIPERVSPNAISVFNHVVCWVTVCLAYLSTILPPLGRMLVLLAAGVGMFVSMLADCLDGMQARRTDRCSKLGQVLDHWLDAIHCPLVTFGITLALQMDPWAIAAVHITNAMIYNAQLVLHHHTGRFVHPGTSGVDAEFGVSFGYIVTGIFFYFFDPGLSWVRVLVLVAVAIALFVHTRLNLFYYIRLKGVVVHHLPFVALCGGFGALYLMGAMGTLPFLLAVTFISFRITGGYVLFTVLGKRFSGFDLGILLWIIAIAAHHFLPISAALRTYDVLPYLACLYMAARSVIDFIHHLPALRPS